MEIYKGVDRMRIKIENKYLIITIIFLAIIFKSCITQGFVVKEENIPVNWGNWQWFGSSDSQRVWSNVISIIDQNIRRYRYYIYTYSINDESNEKSWDHKLNIITYTNGETISMVFNYFAIYLHFTDNPDLRINGIPARLATIRGSANDFNATLDRIYLLLEHKEFSDSFKRLDDGIWLTRNLPLAVNTPDN